MKEFLKQEAMFLKEELGGFKQAADALSIEEMESWFGKERVAKGFRMDTAYDNCLYWSGRTQ